MNDPIADILIRIRNAGAVAKKQIDVPYSKIKFEIVRILANQEMVDSFKKATRNGKKIIRIYLKYNEKGKHAISGSKRISKPGQRIYVSADKIKPVKSGRGVSVISTSRGIMIGKEARRKNIGGEVLFEIW